MTSPLDRLRKLLIQEGCCTYCLNMRSVKGKTLGRFEKENCPACFGSGLNVEKEWEQLHAW